MSAKDSPRSGPHQAADRRNINRVRAAGAATIASGGLAILGVVLAVTVAGAPMNDLTIWVALAIGVLLCGLGLTTLRIRAWSLWATAAVMAVWLGGQLWVAQVGDDPQGATVSVFSLIVPLVVLVINVLAIGAIRRLRIRP